MVGWVFLSSLVCAAFIDLDHMIIPDRFTIGLGVVGVILSGLVPEIQGQCGNSFVLASTHAITISIHGLLIGSGLVLWIALLLEIALQKEALSFGDVKFVGAIGAFTGWQGAVIVVFGGSVIGSLWLFLAWIWQKKVGVGGPLKSETPEGHPTPLKILSSTPTISLAASRRSPIT
jgi:leader peptidase (prepilin peptidase)/N-methyltransferase